MAMASGFCVHERVRYENASSRIPYVFALWRGRNPSAPVGTRLPADGDNGKDLRQAVKFAAYAAEFSTSYGNSSAPL
jgi:hypothetical protein